MSILTNILLALVEHTLALGETEASGVVASPSSQIYVYSLDRCSFDHFPNEQIDDPLERNPPLLPIHTQITKGRYATSNAENATLFYIPAPFCYKLL